MTNNDRLQAQIEFRDQLVSAGLLIPLGTAGLMGRNNVFEGIIRALSARLEALGQADQETHWHFPPVIPRSLVHRVGYLRSFPDLLGSLHAFEGTEKDQRIVLEAVESGAAYGEQFNQADAVLLPASCYPIYLALEGTMVPKAGAAFHTVGMCYRHEPSPDPARLRCFRQHEHVLLGCEERVDEYAQKWHEQAVQFLRSLGLPAELVVANDPFFGRSGRLMKAQQNEQALKHEVVVPITSTEHPTAIASINRHHDHFGTPFSIGLSDGNGPAYSACVGFGMERVTLALLKHHGLDPVGWDRTVRDQLWP